MGTVAYTGYTEGAKKSSAKSNHASVVKYIAAEDAKCTVGSDKVFGTDVDNVILLCRLTLTAQKNCFTNCRISNRSLKDFKNPYDPNTTAAVEAGTGTDSRQKQLLQLRMLMGFVNRRRY